MNEFPTLEQMENLSKIHKEKNKLLENENKKMREKDCKFLMNLMNNLLHKSLKTQNVIEQQEIDVGQLNHFTFNCADTNYNPIFEFQKIGIKTDIVIRETFEFNFGRFSNLNSNSNCEKKNFITYDAEEKKMHVEITKPLTFNF